MQTQVAAAPRKPVTQTTSTNESQSDDGGSGLRNLLIGGGVCILGVVVTVIGYMHPDANGTYRVMIGAIVFGGLQALRGLMQIMSGN